MLYLDLDHFKQTMAIWQFGLPYKDIHQKVKKKIQKLLTVLQPLQNEL